MTCMNSLRLARCAWVLGLIAALVAPTAVAQTKLLLNNFIPRNHHQFTDVFVPWAKQVETATQGRVTVEFSASSLAPIPRQFDMVTSGIADLTLDQMLFNPNRFELGKLAEFPFVSDSSEAIGVALWRTYEKFFAKANEYEGVKVLSFMTAGANHLWTASRPVAKLEDAKGLKIRMGGVYASEVAQTLGIAPVAAPGPKAYELVSGGVVDGTTFAMIDIVNFKLASRLRYVTTVPGGFLTSGFAFILNKAKWDSLSKTDQSALMSVSGEAYARFAGKAWDQANERARLELQKEGVQETRLSPEFVAELKRRLAPIETTWLAAAQKKGVDGKAALEYFRAQVVAVERGQ